MNLYDVETSYDNGLAAQSSGLTWDELKVYLRALKDHHAWDELTISRRRPAAITVEARPAELAEEEPEPDEYDPGPECDDEGGMSEYRRDYPALGDYLWER